MTTILIDPTLRRARLVRATFLMLAALVLSTVALFARGLVPEARAPLPLPSPRRALAPERGRRPRPESGQRRPKFGIHPKSGQPDVALHNDRGARSIAVNGGSSIASHGRSSIAGSHPPSIAGSIDHKGIDFSDPDPPALAVTAFLDPSAPGALASLDRHATDLDAVAEVGLLLGDGGEVIDRLDEAGLDVARSHALPIRSRGAEPRRARRRLAG